MADDVDAGQVSQLVAIQSFPDVGTASPIVELVIGHVIGAFLPDSQLAGDSIREQNDEPCCITVRGLLSGGARCRGGNEQGDTADEARGPYRKSHGLTSERE